MTGSLWGFKWLQGRKCRWQQPHPYCLSSLNSLEKRAPQVIHGQNVLTMVLATFAGTNENALLTMNTNQIPLRQVLILSASHQGMAFSFPEH